MLTLNLYRDVDINEEEQLVFSSRVSQAEYFANHLVASNVPFTPIRKTGTLRVEIAPAIIASCNYLSYTHPYRNNETTYARIIDYNYINKDIIDYDYIINGIINHNYIDNCTEITCVIDRRL